MMYHLESFHMGQFPQSLQKSEQTIDLEVLWSRKFGYLHGSLNIVLPRLENSGMAAPRLVGSKCNMYYYQVPLSLVQKCITGSDPISGIPWVSYFTYNEVG
jgi:hypothetical protein